MFPAQTDWLDWILKTLEETINILQFSKGKKVVLMIK